MTKARGYVFAMLTSLLYACGPSLPEVVELEMDKLPEVIDYNFHVKPIISDRCFICHGPDGQMQKANLRLDTEEGAYAALESGNGHAVVPGSASRSQLVSRILSDNPEEIMPPEESNLKLTDEERAILIKWIEQGAEYKPHWAFTPPEMPDVPEVDDKWAVNEIDQFVVARLSLQNILPSPEAEREQLIRRAYFDITGLPPTINDLERWTRDESEDYYERMIDHLLASPSYGERMAGHWLDVARFADSEGYLDDFHHAFWPYRDWVINAFNDNLPYDDFILWQVGGDQIPNATEEQVLATAFNRNHKQNSEGGIIPEEFRVEYVTDRTNTLGTAFMGLTVGCAKCHDHKYDPISQKDYYQLFGFFNSTVERGDGIFSLNALENGKMLSNKYAMSAGPVMPLLDDEVKEIRDYLKTVIDDSQENLAKAEIGNKTQFEKWRSETSTDALKKAIDQSTVNHLTFDDMSEGRSTDKAIGAGPIKYYGSIAPAKGKFGQAVKSNAHGQLVADGSRAQFERSDPFTISFWINTPKDFESAHVLYNGNNRIQGYRGWDIVVEDGKLHFRLNHAHPYQSLDISTSDNLALNEWIHFTWTYDGSSTAEGMRVYKNGEAIAMNIDRNFIYRSTKPYLTLAPTIYMPYQGLVIGNRHYDNDFTNGLVDEVRILNRESNELVARYLYDKGLGIRGFSEAIKFSNPIISEFYNQFIDEGLEKKRVALRVEQVKEIELLDSAREIMVMGDYPEARPTFILNRGVYDDHGEPVTSDVPEYIFPMPEDLPKNRYGLGKWLTHPYHPLTARVAVNQYWYLMFGRGIVETVEDFGNQGALPSHPELLDWLAIDFMESGWDTKRLVKQMLMSATYRQSSVVRPELKDVDPQNIYLARGPRYRRSAEMIRDNVLVASGLLEDEVGGASTFPYQPPGLWKEVMTHPFFPGYEVDYKEGLYRRSVYTFWKRSMPPPNMLVFDASSRAECQVRRLRSNTPLQALALLNDPQMIEGCRAIAERMLKEANGNSDQALINTFRTLTSRMPTEREQKIFKKQFQEEKDYFMANQKACEDYLAIGAKMVSSDFSKPEIAAVARVSGTILNTTEAYYKN